MTPIDATWRGEDLVVEMRMTTRFAVAGIIKHPVSSPASHPILDKICKFEIGSLTLASDGNSIANASGC
jgi:hypothetical protein